MRHKMRWRKTGLAAMATLVVLGFSSGCATKKYVRAEVASSAQDLSTRIDDNGQRIEGNAAQIEELNTLSREHAQRMDTMDGHLQEADERGRQALSTGETAHTIAVGAADHVTALEGRFRDRNRYQTLFEESVRFPFDSAQWQEPPQATLDKVARAVRENPDAVLVLEGRTDSTGEDTYNIRLGERRLDAVERYLVVELGVPFHRLYRMSYGEAQPIAPNESREGREQNRSVVLRVMGPAGGGSAEVISANQDSNQDSM